jgi:hypothetical protein
MENRTSFTAAVRAYLTARPGVWVHAGVLQEIGGRFASRTRISDARKELEAEGLGTIANQLQPVWYDGKIVRRDSFYRFEPVTPMTETPSQGHDLNSDWVLR